jgi:hypothetical protein
MTPIEAVMPTFCPSCGSMRLGDVSCDCAAAGPPPSIVARLMDAALPSDVVVPNLRNLVRGTEDRSALVAEMQQLEDALVLDFVERFSREPLLRHMDDAVVRPEVRAHLVVLARAAGAE